MSDAIPAGFKLEKDETTAAGVEYPVEFLQAESLDAIVQHYESQGNSRADAEAIVLGVWNAHNKQGAMQSPKTGIRKALSEDGADVDAAVKAAQETTRQFITGAPRQRAGGVTKKAASEMGVEIAKAQAAKGSTLTKAELDEIMSQYIP